MDIHVYVYIYKYTRTHTHTRTCSNPNHGMASLFSFVLNTFAAAFLVLEGKGLPSGV